MNKFTTSIQTLSGSYLNLLDPSGFDIHTIAHSLSCVSRFTGHTRRPYSVAQHAVLCSRIPAGGLPADRRRADAYAKLMHDNAEAYIGDVSSPLKKLLPQYRDIESVIESRLNEQFGVDADQEILDSVKKADLMMLVTEKRDLLPDNCREDDEHWSWIADMDRLDDKVVSWGHLRAKYEFLARFYELCPDFQVPVRAGRATGRALRYARYILIFKNRILATLHSSPISW